MCVVAVEKLNGDIDEMILWPTELCTVCSRVISDNNDFLRSRLLRYPLAFHFRDSLPAEYNVFLRPVLVLLLQYKT